MNKDEIYGSVIVAVMLLIAAMFGCQQSRLRDEAYYKACVEGGGTPEGMSQCRPRMTPVEKRP